MIDLFKKLLIEANHAEDDFYSSYSNSTVKSFGSQILQLFNYEGPANSYKIFVENWLYLVDAMFEIYMKALRNDSRSAIHSLDIQKIVSKAKFKEQKQFNIHVCQKLLECTRFLNANWKQIDEKTVNKIRNSSENKSCLECYYDFSRSFVYYIKRDITDIKNCCKTVLDLLIELSKLTHESVDCLKIISELLYKDNFYVLKDYKAETVILTQNLVELAYEFAEVEHDDLSEAVKTRYDCIKNIFNYLKERLSKFPESLNAVQDCLFDKVYCKPVEENITSNKFFYLITYDLLRIVDTLYIFGLSENHKQRYSKVLAIFVSNDILESIQPEYTVKSLNKLRYYESWFRNIGYLLKEGKNFEDSFVQSLIKIIKEIKETDNFVNVFDDTSFTINYQIIQALSWTLLNPAANEKLIAALVDIWAYLFEKNVIEFKKSFYTFMTNVARLYGKNLTPIADKMWEAYLDDLNENNLIIIIDSIMPWTYSLFMEKYFLLTF